MTRRPTRRALAAAAVVVVSVAALGAAADASTPTTRPPVPNRVTGQWTVHWLRNGPNLRTICLDGITYAQPLVAADAPMVAVAGCFPPTPDLDLEATGP